MYKFGTWSPKSLVVKCSTTMILSHWIFCICLQLVCIGAVKLPNDNCRFTLVESIPEGLTYPKDAPISLSTYAAHKRLLDQAEKDIHIASFYWSMKGSDTSYSDNSSFEGEDIYKSLRAIVLSHKLDVKIAQNANNNDTMALANAGAQVRTVNFTRLMHAGILHTKLWVVDGTHMYVGSANFDWRSYTQVKETGLLIENCQEVVTDVEKIFDVYWYLGQSNATIPPSWPASYATKINSTSPLPLAYNNSKGLVYLSSSPPPFCPSGRTGDIDAILNVIFSAREFIYISVMDYLPLIIYQYPKRFWPVIDDALRKVAYEKRVKVYLMTGCWNHTMADQISFQKVFGDLRFVHNMDVHAKYFHVPVKSASQAKIPYARVNHSKFMVTDKHAYIGTSNWSGDYFISTGGVGFILESAKQNSSLTSQADLRQQLEELFLRDWTSTYASYDCYTSAN